MTQERNEELASEIPVYRINGFAEADEYTGSGDNDLMLDKLRELGFSNHEFAFRAIDRSLLTKVLENGTDRDDDLLDISLVFPGEGVFSRQELDQLLRNMNDCRENETEAAFVVYNLNQLDDNPSYKEGESLPEWTFKYPANKRSAIKSVVIAEDFGVID